MRQARVSIDTGRPLMRPLCFDHPADRTVWQWPYQWKLGDDLLVAPVIRPGVSSWPVYLPEGEWADLFTGERHHGPAVVERPVPLDEIPVYRRLSGVSDATRDSFSGLRT